MGGVSYSLGLPWIWWSPEQFDTWNQLKNEGVLAKEWFLSGGSEGGHEVFFLCVQILMILSAIVRVLD